MDGMNIQSGTFVSTGVPTILGIRSDLDYMKVINYSVIGTNPNPLQGYQFEWFRGMAAGDAIMTYNTAGALTLQQATIATVNTISGFTLINQGNSLISPVLGARVAFTQTSNANPVVVSTASTVGLVVGSVVILSQAAANLNVPSILGIPVTVTAVVANTSFSFVATAPGAVGNAGFYRIVNIQSQFFPTKRFIFSITQGATPTVTTTVNHGYSVGQIVQFNVPSVINGMTQINTLTGTILTTTANAFTININTTAFTAFTFPPSTGGANPVIGSTSYTPATVQPVGVNTAYVLANTTQLAPINPFSDSLFNASVVGIQLGAGVQGPAGVNGNIIYWYATKSYVLGTD
jgi:hypothetical protein